MEEDGRAAHGARDLRGGVTCTTRRRATTSLALGRIEVARVAQHHTREGSTAP